MSGLIASSVGARWRACVCCESLQSYPADQRMFHNTWSTLRFDFSVNFQIHLGKYFKLIFFSYVSHIKFLNIIPSLVG